MYLVAVTCGLGLVQDLTLIMTPPPQLALHGVFTVDQGLHIRAVNEISRTPQRTHLQPPLMLMMTFCEEARSGPMASRVRPSSTHITGTEDLGISLLYLKQKKSVK